MTEALAAVCGALRCPVCRQPVALDDRVVRCPVGHAVDVARQGYVSLTRGRRRIAGDSTAMVDARDRVLRGGAFEALATAVVDTLVDILVDGVGGDVATGATGRVVADLGGGTGHYSARLLDALPRWRGICIDVSAPALRRAARAHPRLAAVGTDLGLPLPLGDGAVDAVLSVFGPRDVAEIRRVLSADGVLVVASPEPGHLRELVDGAGLVSVDPAKDARLAARLTGWTALRSRRVEWPMTLDHASATDLAVMGPTGHHVRAADLAARVARLPQPVTVTGSVRISAYRRPATAADDRDRRPGPSPAGPVARARHPPDP